MNWQEFLSNLVASLAWPIVTLIFLYLFKNELGNLVQKLAHIKYKDLELDFGKVTQEASDLRRERGADASTKEVPSLGSLGDQIFEAAENTPGAAILLAWSSVETAMASAVARLCISLEPPSYRSPAHNIDMLSSYGDLDEYTENLLRDMRKLRNQVAHDGDSKVSISESQALDYAHVAKHIVDRLNSMKLNDSD